MPQDYLPPSVQDAFLTTVTEFMLLPWREAARHALADASQGGSQACGWPRCTATADSRPRTLTLPPRPGCMRGDVLASWAAKAAAVTDGQNTSPKPQ